MELSGTFGIVFETFFRLSPSHQPNPKLLIKNATKPGDLVSDHFLGLCQADTHIHAPTHPHMVGSTYTYLPGIMSRM